MASWLGQAAARRVREHYGAAVMVRQHEEAYGKLLNPSIILVR